VAEPLYVILSQDGHSRCQVYARPAPPMSGVPALVAALAALLGQRISQQTLWMHLLRYAGSANLAHPMWQPPLRTVEDRDRAVKALQSSDIDNDLLWRLCAAAVGRRIAVLPREALLASSDTHPATVTVVPASPSWLPPVYIATTPSLCHAVFPTLLPSSPPWPPDPAADWRAQHSMCERCLAIGHHAFSACSPPVAGVSRALGKRIRRHHTRSVRWLYDHREPQ